MSDEQDKKEAVQRLFDQLENDGVAVGTVTNGHVLMFKRATLQEMLDKYPGQSKFTIFVQKPVQN